MRLFWIVAAAWLALDQLSKLIVVHWMNLAEVGIIPVLPPVLTFVMGWNEGVNFGLGARFDLRWALVGLSLVVAAWLVWWTRRSLGRPLARAAAGLIVGGALGNALDRVVYGAVADFLNVTCCGIANPFAFNVADIGIFVGAAGLVAFADPDTKTP